MVRRLGRVAAGLSVVVLAFGLAGCGGGGSGGADGTGGGGNGNLDVDIASLLANRPASSNLSGGEGWPAGAPKDIPPFPGKLTSLMPQRVREADGLIRARMFFEGVTTDQFYGYLKALKDQGYALKATVYYTRDRSAAERRAREGDVDQVAAKKGTRNLSITSPGETLGDVTYDLGGLTDAEADALWAVPWPPAWADKVPGPEWCKLEGLNAIATSADKLEVSCNIPGDDAAARKQKADAYVAFLESKGFKRTASYPGDKTIKLNDGTYYVKVTPNVSVTDPDQYKLISIKATKGPDPWDNPGSDVPTIPPVELPTPPSELTPPPGEGGWPADWAAKVPAPDGCTIAHSSSAGASASITCTYPSSGDRVAVVAGYKAKLVAAGFEVDTEVKTGGSTSMLMLSRGTLRVSVMASAPDSMTIMLIDTA